MTKKVIFTGFLPFGGYQFNPTEDLVRYFNSYVTIPQIEIMGLVLPCTYFGAFEKLSKIIDKEKPDAIISMGLSSCVKGIRIETTFRNLMNGKYPDMSGYDPAGIPICNEINAREFLTSNVSNIFFSEYSLFREDAR
jgi:pyroglutamyl-peptidase